MTTISENTEDVMVERTSLAKTSERTEISIVRRAVQDDRLKSWMLEYA